MSDKSKRRRYDIEDGNELFGANVDAAAQIDVDVDRCLHPMISKWLRNYDHVTSSQPLSLYYALLTTIAHLTMESVVMQWNNFPRFMNLYSIILGFSGSFVDVLSLSVSIRTGSTKSGSIKECRDSLEDLYDFLAANNIGDPNMTNAILDTFTDAGFIDQVNLPRSIGTVSFTVRIAAYSITDRIIHVNHVLYGLRITDNGFLRFHPVSQGALSCAP
jgi:hypothetical protein